MGKLDGEVAIITGGAAGLGNGIVTKFVSEGASVVILDFNITPIKGSNPKIKVVQGTVVEHESWKRALDTALESFGKVTIIVNNAGVVTANTPTHTTDISELDRVLNVNLKGIFVGVQVIIPYMEKEKIKGCFVNITSTSGIRPRAGLAYYAASKGGAIMATKSMALEYAHLGIRFVGIAPVVANTQMMACLSGGEVSEKAAEELGASIPIGRIVEPEDIGNMAAQLASKESSMITGTNFEVDGGRCV